MSRVAASVAALALAGLALGGCANPDAGSRVAASEATPGSPGEPPAPAAPPPGGSARPRELRRTPKEALFAFAELYVNWDYRTLTGRQRTLAAISVASARTSELQAAASSSADATIRAGRIRNSGQVLSIGSQLGDGAVWVIVTRERTSGGEQYAGLGASDHVTIARLVHLAGGYAVSEWLPQS